jgi:hypothetical protein
MRLVSRWEPSVASSSRDLPLGLAGVPHKTSQYCNFATRMATTNDGHQYRNLLLDPASMRQVSVSSLYSAAVGKLGGL